MTDQQTGEQYSDTIQPGETNVEPPKQPEAPQEDGGTDTVEPSAQEDTLPAAQDDTVAGGEDTVGGEGEQEL